MTTQNEDERPPDTKIRLAATVAKEVIDQMKAIYGREVKLAVERDFPEPAWSAIVEMLLRKGLKAYKLKEREGRPNR